MATQYLGDQSTAFTAKKGIFSVDAQGGVDTLIYNLSDHMYPLRYYDYYGWRVWTDDDGNSLSVYGFEIYRLTGGLEADDLRGGDLADILRGMDGDDELRSYKGGDLVDGGAGYDRWIVDYSSIPKPINLALTGGEAGFLVAATGATVVGIEALTIKTSAAADVIDTSGVLGDDDIELGGGNDILRPGFGRDRANGGDGIDLLVLNYGSGLGDIRRIDLGYGWMRYADSSGVNETTSIDFYGFERFDITGGQGHDWLYGGSLNDVLKGGMGNDSLHGFGGVDQIDGGDGVDAWQADFSERVGHFSVDINAASQFARVGTVVAATIANIEKIDLTLGAGNDRIVAKSGQFDDRVSAGGGADVVVTGRGRDWVHAGDGDDKLIVNWSATSASVTWGNQGYGWYRLSNQVGDRVDYYGVERFELTGGSAGDVLVGFDGIDVLRGGGGNDHLNSGKGRATVDGGIGIDYWEADLRDFVNPVIVDALASQTVAQGGGAGLSISKIEGLRLAAGEGNDVLKSKGYATDDVIDAGKGDDVVAPGLGFDRVNGEEGEDRLILDFSGVATAVTRSDEGYGWFDYADRNGVGKVSYYGFEKFDLTGTAANDYLFGGGLADRLIGGAGNDVLNAGGGVDFVDGGLGIDHWIGSYSDSVDDLQLALDSGGNGGLTGIGAVVKGIERLTLTTGVGDDRVVTSNRFGADVIQTGDGDDYVKVVGGRDEVNMGAGVDRLSVDFGHSLKSIVTRDLGYGWKEFADTSGANVIKFYGAESLDVLGGVGADRLSGGVGADTIRGAAGADVLWGEDGDDVLQGGLGADLLIGGSGVDVLAGGEGADRFRFGSQSEGVDQIVDFVSGLDKVQVVSSAFAGLPSGLLPAGSLFSTASALPAAPVFVFDPGTSRLLFDPDGGGSAAPSVLAVISGVSQLLSTDIQVVS